MIHFKMPILHLYSVSSFLLMSMLSITVSVLNSTEFAFMSVLAHLYLTTQAVNTSSNSKLLVMVGANYRSLKNYFIVNCNYALTPVTVSSMFWNSCSYFNKPKCLQERLQEAALACLYLCSNVYSLYTTSFCSHMVLSCSCQCW